MIQLISRFKAFHSAISKTKFGIQDVISEKKRGRKMKRRRNREMHIFVSSMLRYMSVYGRREVLKEKGRTLEVRRQEFVTDLTVITVWS